PPMSHPAVPRALALCALLALTAASPADEKPVVPPPYRPDPEELRQAYQRAGRAGAPRSRVYKSQVTPNWFHDNTRFWYRNDLRGGAREFILVDAEKGTRQPAFDHEKLARALSKAAGADYKADRLPFDAIEFIDEDRAVRFRAAGATWKCDLAGYECGKAEGKSSPPPAEPSDPEPAPAEDVFPVAPQAGEQPVAFQPQPRPQDGPREARSPDRKWTAFVKDYNVWLRPADGGAEEQLTRDGTQGRAFGMLAWSPDSKALTAFRIEPGDIKDVYLIQSSPPGGGRAKLQTRPYALPGDKFPTYELWVIDPANKKAVKAEVDPIELEYGRPRLRWLHDKRHFTYEQADRGHQRFRLVEVDAATGKSRNVIDEKSETFIWTAHGNGTYVNYLDNDDEVLLASERDGWRHIYLIDAKEGKVKNQVTKGEWVVRGIDRVDEKRREIWFRASGRNPGQDPYLIHYYRVNFDGTGLVALTEGDGSHSVRYSPDRKYLIDLYSRADLPPVHELRRVADGKLVCELERADVSELRENGWEPPEVFVAKGRDGKTDIWGIICRPPRLDPAKSYPVIEYIYAGPHDSHVPKGFSPARRFAALTELGFIVVQIDGMGTANRSKAFHDVCWHNLADAGFPDRIPWHRAVAKKYPYYDVNRVGIYGTSAGGQNSTGALLFHGDFYKAAISACGCHDNRMDKASWNEQWMGYPVGPHYAANSNITN
ncbi:MAG TPA: DPP IV N-terminal domain-containing protein, partial [Gemmataceae bacterium]|nr:DPP IV N-terminal domain-containing protein [Gemmataceae bacterium]